VRIKPWEKKDLPKKTDKGLPPQQKGNKRGNLFKVKTEAWDRERHGITGGQRNFYRVGERLPKEKPSVLKKEG